MFKSQQLKTATPKIIRGFAPDQSAELAEAKLKGSGLTQAQANKLGIKTMTGQEVLEAEIWRRRALPALVFHYFDANGQPLMDGGTPFARYRALQDPHPKPKKFAKYIQLPGTQPHVYLPHGKVQWAKVLKDATKRLVLTEGELKGAAGCNAGFNVLALGGVWSFRSGKAGYALLPELEGIVWQDREVFLCFDADPSPETSDEVARARQVLANLLIRRGARVFLTELPATATTKVGLDDFLLTHTPADFSTLLDESDPMVEMQSPVEALVEELNRDYAIVNENGKVWIYKDHHEVDDRRILVDRLSERDFLLLMRNRKVAIDGETFPAGAVWLASPERREYPLGSAFDPQSRDIPGFYNYYRGRAVEPVQGDWSLMHAHLKNVVCNGSPECFEYLMGWMARMMQKPWERAEVAVVMRGKEGSGKGILANTIARILAPHSFATSSAKHVVGHFNSHLETTIFLFADEAFFAGDVAHVATLKALLTEPYIATEGKFRNAVNSKNFLHVMMASNSDWVIPASLEARRFFMLDIPDTHVKDFPYFAAISKQMADGGDAAMLYDLLHYDISEFKIIDIPQTEALEQQKRLSLPSLQLWWDACLSRGFIYLSPRGTDGFDGSWSQKITTELAYSSYLDFHATKKVYHPTNRVDFGKFLASVGCKRTKIRNALMSETFQEATLSKDQQRGYVIPALAEAREAFRKVLGFASMAWPDEGEVDEPREREKPKAGKAKKY